ncbi:hypothetical protein [Bacillus sp. SM2101]|uniref:hypothetical protein n=1 Tax=Bacillus sp. SM2101 TaxID=2805366 RepID=UPI002032D356|nr:hypothetical protein [Bacillus sp. SM2101]
MFATVMWSIYLIFLAASLIVFLYVEKLKTKRQKLDLVMHIITFIGLFGYVYNVQMLTPFIWMIIFVCALIWGITGIVFPPGYIKKLSIIESIFGVLISIPLYYGLYQYAF